MTALLSDWIFGPFAYLYAVLVIIGLVCAFVMWVLTR